MPPPPADRNDYPLPQRSGPTCPLPSSLEGMDGHVLPLIKGLCFLLSLGTRRSWPHPFLGTGCPPCSSEVGDYRDPYPAQLFMLPGLLPPRTHISLHLEADWSASYATAVAAQPFTTAPSKVCRCREDSTGWTKVCLRSKKASSEPNVIRTPLRGFVHSTGIEFGSLAFEATICRPFQRPTTVEHSLVLSR